jgi:hypothetical protein
MVSSSSSRPSSALATMISEIRPHDLDQLLARAQHRHPAVLRPRIARERVVQHSGDLKPRLWPAPDLLDELRRHRPRADHRDQPRALAAPQVAQKQPAAQDPEGHVQREEHQIHRAREVQRRARMRERAREVAVAHQSEHLQRRRGCREAPQPAGAHPQQPVVVEAEAVQEQRLRAQQKPQEMIHLAEAPGRQGMLEAGQVDAGPDPERQQIRAERQRRVAARQQHGMGPEPILQHAPAPPLSAA